ncbi:MAG: hypothetical protein MZV64_16920 [Ignavibacteriales bacterium]|nr:hypothetical protein [Ignavibacteriales bacterium]
MSPLRVRRGHGGGTSQDAVVRRESRGERRGRAHARAAAGGRLPGVPYALPEFPDVVATITTPVLFGDRLLGILHVHTTEPGKRFIAGRSPDAGDAGDAGGHRHRKCPPAQRDGLGGENSSSPH